MKVITLLEVSTLVNAIVGMATVSEISRVPLGPTPVVRGVEVWRPPRIARNLNQAQGWLKELGNIYREMRRGQLASTCGTRLAYVASVGARLAKDLEDLKEAEAIRAQLERLGHAPPVNEVSTPDDRHEVVGDEPHASF
jgi:hypothetical protein